MPPTNELLEGLPPQSLDAEKALLASLLLDPDRIASVAGMLSVDDFYADAHRKIFAAMLAESHELGGTDLHLLVERLKKSADLEAVGGVSYLAEVAQASPTAHHTAYYAQIVATKAAYRRVIHTATELLRRAYAEEDEPRTLLNEAESALASVETDAHRGSPVKAADAASEAMARVYQVQRRSASMGLPTGLVTFDEMTGGLFPGELCILAARTAVGKTSLACQVAEHNASQDRGVYVASLEMSAMELATRTICGQAQVDSRCIRRGKVEPEQSDAMGAVAQKWADWPLWIHDRPGITVPEITRWARRLKKSGLRLVVVDYLQLLTPQDRRVNRYEQIGQMTAGLKALARELELPVLCLAQLSRQADQDDKTEPRLSHFRESGSIEQDADMALMLWRNPADQHKGEPDVVRFIVKKNRNGAVGAVYLTWEPQFTRFSCGQAPVPANHEPAFDQYAEERF